MAKLFDKYIKKGAIFALLLLVFVTFVPQAYAAEEETKQEQEEQEEKEEKEEKDEQKEQEKQEELDRLENERQETLDAIKGLKESISSAQSDIDKLTAEKNGIQSFINKLDKQSDNLSKEISAFEEMIEAKAADIEATQAELEEVKIACDEQYEAMKKRIEFIYENPGASWIELLFSSKNIVELVNHLDYVTRLSDYDRDMMDKLIDTKDAIAMKEVTLQAEMEELEMLQDELKTQKKKVGNSISSKKSELSSKNNDIGDAKADQKDFQKQLEEQERLLNEIEDQIARTANPDAYEGEISGFIWPCPGYTRISSYFGPRPQPTAGASTDHKGVDLAAPEGSAILASASGKVTTATYSNSAGNYIVIAHGNGMSTVNMLCTRLLGSVGQTVKQGDTIAKVGSTGYSTGNHLHFGVIKNGAYVDPLGYVKKP